jgi:hypothetical protein
MITLDDRPEFCWSELTSAISGSADSRSRSFGPQNAHVLGVLQEHVRPRQAGRLAAQAGDHLVRRGLANPRRLELNVDHRRVPAGTAPAGARHHGDGFDIRVLSDLLLEPFRLLHQRLVGDVLLADDGASQASRILLREESLRDFHVQAHVDAHRQQHREQDGRGMIQHAVER